ncbi:glycoside hydrolase family 3 C-terminal domain-containing protein [Aggregatilineales bacterium SYSU G02658]
MQHDSPAVERLGIPAYNWWNEASHGVARAGLATVFPAPIGQAATFNLDLTHQIGVAVSDEARAKYHDAMQRHEVIPYLGLTAWTPNINLARDPRWGRIQETYGEDPYLTARMGITYIRALQGSHPTYLKLAACAKHFAAHSGPEAQRHSFNATVSTYDLWDTYLPHFEACVVEGQVEAVMGAYSRINGESGSASPTLLTTILRERWGFTGHVVSDCGAIDDLYLYHGLANTPAEAAALALNAGCDLECGCIFSYLSEALRLGLTDEAAIDRALTRVMTTRFRLGMFDPPDEVPYAAIPSTIVACEQHDKLALQAARESIVLLKNDGLLPLSRGVKSIAVIGPNAAETEVLLGNYHGTPARAVSILDGLRSAAGRDTTVTYAQGCSMTAEDAAEFDAALNLAAASDVIIFVGGLSQIWEGEDQQDESVPLGTISQGDRTFLGLPPPQEHLLSALRATGVPTVLVILSGSAVTVDDRHLSAVVQAWYPGQHGGTAVAEVLFGDYNPAGRLPLTVYRSLEDVPPMEDYEMTSPPGRTYRYLTRPPLYAFGHGLSYTQFAYQDLRVSQTVINALKPDLIDVEATVTNIGSWDGDEVVQLYISPVAPCAKRPQRTLVGFTRIHLNAGEHRTIHFTLKPEAFTRVTETGARVLDAGTYVLSVGGCQPGFEPHPRASVSVHVTFTAE